MLNVWVPNDAVVYVNGNRTSSKGSLRHYISRGLAPASNYAYEVRAEVNRDGKIVSETKQVVVTGGQRASLEFALQNSKANDRVADASATTKLTLHVPAEAKVYLAGREMRSSGEIREFSTTQLAKGDRWNDYTVRVELNRDGQTLTKETTLSLVGGEARELNIDVDGAAVASTANSR